VLAPIHPHAHVGCLDGALDLCTTSFQVSSGCLAFTRIDTIFSFKTSIFPQMRSRALTSSELSSESCLSGMTLASLAQLQCPLSGKCDVAWFRATLSPNKAPCRCQTAGGQDMTRPQPRHWCQEDEWKRLHSESPRVIASYFWESVR
jgi:hypothetical protein